MKLLSTLEEFKELYAKKDLRILFKHSPSCSTSGFAYQDMKTFDAVNDIPIYMLNVLGSGHVKYDIEKEIGIDHESPQIIIFNNGEVIAEASHGWISIDWLQKHAVV